MGLPINVEDMIYQRIVEQTRIEYKADWNPEPIIHTITAFANDFDNLGGGYVIIGIEEVDGRPKIPIKGIEQNQMDSIQLDILNKCNLIEPRYIPVIEPAIVDGREVLVLWIPGGEDRPYKAPQKIYTEKGSEKSPKVYWIRKGSRTLKANHREEQELISLSRDVPYDDRINYHASVDDMRPALIADFLKNVGSDLYPTCMNRTVESVATDMKLVRGPSEYRKPLNVGLMFFNESPDSFFPYARIEVVDKPDPTGVGMTEKIFTGPLNKQLGDALSYIHNYIIKEYVTKLPDRAEAMRVFNWPYQAIEEALSNAVYHKSYQEYEPITVTITPEKIDIVSIPGPDRSITDQNLKDRILVSRRYRNRRIGDILKDLKMVEGRNTGVPLIISAMKDNGSGLPEFITDDDRSYFQVTLPIHPVFLSENIERKAKIKAEKNVRRTREDIHEGIIRALNDKGNLSMRELANTLGYTTLTNTVREVVQTMIKNQEVCYLIPDKPKSRNQKICLVKHGYQ